MSDYVYSCALGLSQSNCTKHQHDPKARGQQWSGCPTCKHRVSASPTTITRDRAFAQEVTLPVK